MTDACHTQGLMAKIQAAEQGVAAAQLKLRVEDESRWAGVPPWKRKLLEVSDGHLRGIPISC